MSPDDVLEKLHDIFRDVFDDDELVIHNETTAEDIEEWDSVAQISLILLIEQVFNISFAPQELEGLANVGDMAALIAGKAS